MRRFLLILLPTLALTWLATAQAAGLNDTGITDCSNDTSVVTIGVASDGGTHPRQDCRYGRDAAAAAGGLPKVGAGGKGFDFQKIANDGTVLDATAALGTAAGDWACTRDNVTGLIWEVKTASGLRSQNSSYSWYSSNAATNGGSVGLASLGNCATSGRCDTEKFVADVNAAGLCGASNWRMPSRQELISIVDYGRIYQAAIDPTYFPGTSQANFWSASASATSSDYAWYVRFTDGSALSDFHKYFPLQVRLVRAGQ